MNELIVRRPELLDFPLNQVTLTSDYQINAFKKELEYLNSYDLDRLLAGFRETVGLKPKADKYQGWEDTEIRGHTMGHYLTACAQAYAQTQDESLLERIQYLILELSESQLPSGYLSAFPEQLFDNVENKQPAWVPWYTMHKIIAGLISVYEATQLELAFNVLVKLGDWAASRTEKWTPEKQQIVLSVEYGGMNDCLYELYKLTGEERHLSAAHAFDEIELFKAIHQGRDILKGKHANTTIPKFLGALKRYQVLGEKEVFYLEAAVNFWDIVVYHHSYITGGNSEAEHFGDPDLLDAKRSDITCETCNSYNMLKLTRELFKLTCDIKYADFYESNYVNAILSSQNPETGMTMYFQPMATGYFKVYSSPFDHFWCCTGTGMESFTKLNDSIYFSRENSLYINQFISSKLNWEEQQTVLVQTSDIPLKDSLQLVMESANRILELNIRIPNWSTEVPSLHINGDQYEPTIKNGYIVIKRYWNSGDKIQIQIPLKVSISKLSDAPHVVGFKYGPIVLSAGLGKDDMTESRTGVLVSVPTRKKLVKDYIIPTKQSVAEWLLNVEHNLVRIGDELAFELKGTDEEGRLIFTPHYQRHNERYGIYWSFIEAGSEELRQHEQRAIQELRIKEATIDSVQVGNDQYELEHQIKGEHTYAGTWEGLNGRRMDPGGWFSYQLKISPEEANNLSVTFSNLHHSRDMEIYLDGELFTVEVFPVGWKREFINKVFELPFELTKGRQFIEVKFLAKGQYNGVYDILRTMKRSHQEHSTI